MSDDPQDKPSQDEQAEDGNVIVGTAGDENFQPTSDASMHDPNKPGPASAPPPSVQSGVPLAEDKAAGVKAGEVPKPPEAPEVAKTPGQQGAPA